MSQYDDPDNGSNTQILGGHWVSFEPCSALHVSGAWMRLRGLTFVYCRDCDAYLDPWDLIVGNFGDFHCTYCAGVSLST